MGRRPVRLSIAFIAALALGSVAAAAGGPTGDPGTIAFYRQVVTKYTSVHAIRARRHGFLAYTAAGTTYRYTFGAKPSLGFVPATESLLYVLRAGRIVQFVDTATARGRPALTYIENAAGAWARLATRTCYDRQPRLPAFWGHPFVGLFGDFAPLQHSGPVVVVHSTYPWGSEGTMSEVDRIAAASKLFASINGRLAGPAGFKWSITSLQDIAAPSKVLQPIPHC